jgi:hypothetical protein
VELMIKKTENGWKWAVETSAEYSVPRTQLKAERPHSVVIPYLYAAADPCEKWWLRLRGNPKRAGEISQASFLLKVEMMGFHLALPWGDSERYDFIVWGRDGVAMRVQVKGTGRLHRAGYEVQPVHSTRKGGKKRYTKKDIDVIAAHVQPEDAWYLIPIGRVGRAKSLRLYPGRERGTGISTARPAHGRVLRKSRRANKPQFVWERWRDAWDVLGEL